MSNITIHRRDLLIGAAATTATPAVAQPLLTPHSPRPTSGAPDADQQRRMTWWHQAKFGMFIHCGLYSAAATNGRWKTKPFPSPNMSISEGFKPEPGAARKWAALAKAAGKKYMVMTTKHHEGFCHWDTKLTNYNARPTGPRRPGARIRRGGARRRPAGGLLLFADGLASSRWRPMRHR